MSDLPSMPCLRFDPPEVYHNTLALSAGASKALLRTPGHFAHMVRNGWAESGGTPALVLGSLVHALVLEPDTVAHRFVIRPTFAGTGSRAERQAWEAEHAGMLHITAEQQDTAYAMAEAVRGHDAAMLALTGQHEVSAYWMQHGVPCRARFDCLSDGFGGDLKTAVDASREGFARACANFAYHRIAAHYLDGYAAVRGEPAAGYLFVVVESSPPHAVGVYELDDADVDLGRRQMERAAARFRDYLSGLEQPDDRPDIPAHYTAGVERISLPAWAHYAEDAAA